MLALGLLHPAPHRVLRDPEFLRHLPRVTVADLHQIHDFVPKLLRIRFHVGLFAHCLGPPYPRPLRRASTAYHAISSVHEIRATPATPAQLAALIRNHWHIGNRLHYVRDFTYDEDRCRVWVRDLPRHLACLTNAAISIIRCQSGFRWVPEANRHYAARPQEALDLLLAPSRC